MAIVLGLLGLALSVAAKRLAVRGDPVVEQVDALLPQTQCGQCTYPGCRPYADAIVRGEANINQCPPGGQETIYALARLLGRESTTLNPAHGKAQAAKVAIIDEDLCIGCKLCIKACPVDAIIGSAKYMHTVIASECTGCDLCVAPCPVDCIEMRPVTATPQDWQRPSPLDLALDDALTREAG